MYDIVILMGEAGAGKDSMMQAVLRKLAEKGHVADVHEIVSCTSRPMREGEAHGINYYYYHPNDFEMKILNDEMLEFTKFNNWWYGTGYDSVRGDGVVNIGVFNPAGVRQLVDRPDCNVKVFWICTCDKNRMLRQLNRENCPDVREIVRRFNADYEDFKDIDFDYLEIPNETVSDFNNGVEEIVCQVETMLAQGQK
jgi:guanylate kinase